MNRDLVCGLFALAIAVGYFAIATSIHASQLDDPVGPTGLPKSYAAVMAVLALVMIARGVLQQRRATLAGNAASAEANSQEWLRARRGAGIIVIGALYILLVPWLGYILSLAGLIVATAYYQGGQINLRLGIIAVLGAVFMWVVFVIVLKVPQPPGLWSSIF